jgi:membrane-associated phospholipid phosphatase
MSMALFLGAHVYDLHRAGSLSTAALATWVAGLVLYVVSIVLSRLYTGMHGFMDVSVGTTLGLIGWVLQRIAMPEVERWVLTSGWSGNVVFVRQYV